MAGDILPYLKIGVSRFYRKNLPLLVLVFPSTGINSPQSVGIFFLCLIFLGFIKCGITIDRDDNAAVNVLNAGFKKIFNTFIIIKPKKIRHKKKKIPTDCGECMPVEGKTYTSNGKFFL